ncbi:16S rRNA (guanine(966)-N(2))-methyltransferase RsmD [Aquabacterium sp.]|uniref:16S rRNA (guanine(966)-N(2))-methyltransferase RsmD n=1 Tax=Aquabacterium sp. TaxID=1872578 RepID=UPI002488CE7C|nr:16S rRNA (guanine(966)-N(2))-methyltransferase RsmD [Aquabacterium sp.]MDI1261086.1 16S rRNA (guanine(966)-N(2))-methyltransferase RsmD [Aquabacterium sp.]
MKPPHSARTARSSQPSTSQFGAAQKAAQKVAAHAAQEVRLIGGRWKRTPLTVPVVAGLRPTPSRVRETLFNWLGQDLSGWRVLDAFAGTGALGFEAASRGAESVCLLEREPVLIKSLRATQAKLAATQVQIVQADALTWMGRLSGGASGFDLVLLDPPFDAGLFEQALLAASRCVPEGGWIYLEAPQAFSDAADPVGAVPGLRVHRQGRAGAVHYHLFQRVEGGSGVSRPAAGD